MGSVATALMMSLFHILTPISKIKAYSLLFLFCSIHASFSINYSPYSFLFISYIKLQQQSNKTFIMLTQNFVRDFSFSLFSFSSILALNQLEKCINLILNKFKSIKQSASCSPLSLHCKISLTHTHTDTLPFFLSFFSSLMEQRVRVF